MKNIASLLLITELISGNNYVNEDDEPPSALMVQERRTKGKVNF